MRRIFIDDRIQSYAKDYQQKLFQNRRANFVKPEDGLRNLIADISSNAGAWSPNWNLYVYYLQNILDNFSEIITLHPSEFDSYKSSKFGMLTDSQLTSKEWGGQSNIVSFSDTIVSVMRFSDARDELLPYYEKMGIRTCVYCNSQYANTVFDYDGYGSIKGGFELDHFKPKDTYPFLCISFFNLHPSCGICNKWKSNKPSYFNLYTDDRNDTISPFHFSLDKRSLIRYMLFQTPNMLRVDFNIHKPSDQLLIQNYEKRFHTTKLYNTFGVEIEPIVWNSKINNLSFCKQREIQFKKLFSGRSAEIRRFLYGFYTKESDIYKQPLTKLKQDVARQLKLIK